MPTHHAITPQARRCEDSLLATLRSLLGFGAVPRDSGQASRQIGVRRPVDDVPGIMVIIAGAPSTSQVGVLMRHREGDVCDIMVFQSPPGVRLAESLPGAARPGALASSLRLIHSASSSGESAVRESMHAARIAARCFLDNPHADRQTEPDDRRPRGLLSTLSRLFVLPKEPVPPPLEEAAASLKPVVQRLRASRLPRLRDLGLALDSCGGLPPETIKAIHFRVGGPLMRVLDHLDQGASMDARAREDIDRIQSALGQIVRSARQTSLNARSGDLGVITHVSADRLEELLPVPTQSRGDAAF